MALQFGTKFWERMRDGAPGSNTGTPISERYFNPIFELIDARLGGLEDVKADWVEASNQLNEIGLERLEQVLGPSFNKLARIAELGFLMAHSTTNETLVVDEVSTFVIDDLDERELFHPSSWVTLTKPTSGSDYAIGRVLSYVRPLGILDVEIKQIVGSAGPHNDWEIIAGSGVTAYVASVASSLQATKTAVAANAAQVATDRTVVAQDRSAVTTARADTLGYRDQTFLARNATIEAAASVDFSDPVFTGSASVQGVRVDSADHGSVASGTETFNASLSAVHTITVAGAHTWAFSGWSPKYSEMEIIATNAGAASLTLPTVHWLKGDGTASTTFADMGVTLQESGRNHFILWSADGGTTVYGKAG